LPASDIRRTVDGHGTNRGTISLTRGECGHPGRTDGVERGIRAVARRPGWRDDAPVAEAVTVLDDFQHLDRGYEHLDKKLRALGLQIVWS